MTPRQIFFGVSERVCFKQLQGRVAAEPVSPYPPGIPMLQIGQVITGEIIDQLGLLLEQGVDMQASDPSLGTVAVVKNDVSVAV